MDYTVNTDEHGEVRVYSFRRIQGDWIVKVFNEDDECIMSTRFSQEPSRSDINEVFYLE